MADRSWTTQSLRARLAVEPTAWPRKGLSPLNKGISVAIVLASALAILETEEQLATTHQRLFFTLEVCVAIVFLAEYVLRVWTCVEDPRFANGWVLGRLRYMRSWPALIDAAALAPVLLTTIGTKAFLLRLLRLLRILSLARLGRFSTAMSMMREAIRSRAYEFILSVMAAGLLLIVSSTLLYLVEAAEQPDAFGSIPRAMWWSVVTLTTVGYGDVYPTTIVGRVLAGLTAITGIGLIAMPTGILAAAFSDALQRHRSAGKK